MQALRIKHHVLLVECRGDCCVCAARGPLQASNTLALCYDLHQLLGPSHPMRMGVKLQALTVQGVALVHWATLSQWHKETRLSATLRLVKDKHGPAILLLAEYSSRVFPWLAS